MPGDFTYTRKFIILKDDYKTIDSINPKGYGKMEIRGKRGLVRLNVENCQGEEYYQAYFLVEKNGEIKEMELGRIITDDRGRGTVDISINLREMELMGFPFEKVEAIVIKQGKDVVLSGYIHGESKIMDKYMKNNSTVESEIGPIEERPTEQEEILEVESKEVSKNFPVGFIGGAPNIDKIEEIVEGKDKEDIQEVVQEEKEELLEEKAPEEVKLQEKDEEYISEAHMEVDEIRQQEATYPFQEFQEAYEPQSNTYEHIEYMRRLNHKNQMTNYILSVLKYFPQVQPFKVYLHGYTWWRIDDDGHNSYKGFLPYYNYLLSADYKYPFLNNSTTCLDQIRKYGHYLFGIYSENNQAKYYVYAIPGRFTMEEHPFKGITGFNTWYDSIDEIGYWILYIDPLTGKVIYPINPMTPVE